MSPRRSPALYEALAQVAPGTPLREGIDRILQAGMGALIVVGDEANVLNICSGGFLLDAAFSPQRLSELAKMDGAIIVSTDAGRIARANVHLVPNPNVPTSETGTRHRTAERVARSIKVPVISVSQRMQVIAVYTAAEKYQIEPVPRVVNKANQALQTLERYKQRLDQVSGSLAALEVEDLVTVRDVAGVLQRSEMVRRIASEVENYIVELGDDGRLVRLQLEELLGEHEDEGRLLMLDYVQGLPGWRSEEAMAQLAGLGTDDLLDLETVAGVLHILEVSDLDMSLTPRGYRMLSRIPRLPIEVMDAVVDRFGNLQKILRATSTDLEEVDGVGDLRARSIKEGLSRLAESSILDRYA